jgi:hypothetical protein
MFYFVSLTVIPLPTINYYTTGMANLKISFFEKWNKDININRKYRMLREYVGEMPDNRISLDNIEKYVWNIFR